MRRIIPLSLPLVIAVLVAPAQAQLGQLSDRLQKAKQAHDDLTFSDEEEKQLGADVSAKLREKYGVVQDRAVHKYVTLVGSLVASASSRPNLPWTFVVLDTEGVNAFAAPGGFIHITRGALALIQNEAELANVLAHEVTHVTAKHTIRAIQKAKVQGAAAASTRKALLEQAANRVYEITLENSFDRGDEMDADKTAVVLASKVGYAPNGLGAFLTRLADRNKALTERSGMFASHPETKARLDGVTKAIASQQLATTATVAARYNQSISFKPLAVTDVAQVAPPAASAEAKPAETKSGGSGKFGLGGLNPLGRENTSRNTIASAGSRGVNPDRDAKGGPNKAAVVVTVTAPEVAEFRKGITG